MTAFFSGVGRATKNLGEVEAQRGQLEDTLQAARRKHAEIQARREKGLEDRTLAQHECGSMRCFREEQRLKLAETQNLAGALNAELAGLDTAAESDLAASAASRTRLRQLEVQRLALILARDSLLLPPPPTPGGTVQPRPVPVSLAGIMAEASEVVRLEHEALDAQLRDAAANTAAADQEREALEGERQAWLEEAGRLQEQQGRLQERWRGAAEALEAVRAEAKERQSRCGAVRSKAETLRVAKERLTEENSRVASDVDANRQVVESLRGVAWQELGDAKEALAKSSQAMRRATEEHERRQLELANLAAAHSQMIATTGGGPRVLRLKAAGSPAAHGAEASALEPARPGSAARGAAGRAPAAAPMLSGAPGLLPTPGRPAASMPRHGGAVQALSSCTPCSARSPRNELRDAGQRLVGRAGD